MVSKLPFRRVGPRSASRIHAAISVAVACVVIPGCLDTGEERVLSIEAAGDVTGVAFLDRNGTGVLEEDDPGLELIRVRLLALGSLDTLARATSGPDGVFEMRRVPVGGYRVIVDPASVPDSVPVVLIDPETVTVARDDTVDVEIGLSFPSVSIADARQLPLETTVFVEGVALTGRTTFGDSTLHVADATGAIRATRVRQPDVLPGDSVRLLGTLARSAQQPILDGVVPAVLSIAEPPIPTPASTAVADAAGDGQLDAALIRITNATITDTATVSGGFRVTVDDGSGSLEVLLDADVPFGSRDQLVPGAVIDAVGVLVPTEAGSWELKPRADADLTIG